MGKIDIDMEYYRLPKVHDRFAVIEGFVRGKDVLDLGCINHDIMEEHREDWLHGFIKERAKSVTGVDYLPKEVAKLRKKGYDIVCADVEKMKLGKKYDVVVAGELIEHLSNVGEFLDRVSEHLRPKGVLIVTTPNAFSIRNLLRSLVLGWVPTNREHSAWFCVKTLTQILTRKGFTPIHRYYYFDGARDWRHHLEAFFAFFRNSFTPGMLFISRKG